MKTSRLDNRRLLDYSQIKVADNFASMQNAIETFVRGIQGKRTSSVSLTQIEKWFFATPKEFVGKALHELVTDGRVERVQGGRWAVSYRIPEPVESRVLTFACGSGNHHRCPAKNCGCSCHAVEEVK